MTQQIMMPTIQDILLEIYKGGVSPCHLDLKILKKGYERLKFQSRFTSLETIILRGKLARQIDERELNMLLQKHIQLLSKSDRLKKNKSEEQERKQMQLSSVIQQKQVEENIKIQEKSMSLWSKIRGFLKINESEFKESAQCEQQVGFLEQQRRIDKKSR